MTPGASLVVPRLQQHLGPMLLAVLSVFARLLLVFAILFLLPLATHAAWYALREDTAPDWSRADWSSAHLLPAPARDQGAVVRIYAARTGRWKGIFAHHSWVVVKEAGATRYTRFDKVGWGSPVRTNAWPADARWFGNAPLLVVALDGPAAEAVIPKIRAAVADYPYAHYGDYRVWPGPNSNTFIAHVMSEVPELQAALPPTALGKDYHPVSDIVSPTPSRTGFQIQLGGYLGLTLGWVEGLEVNCLGLVAGFDLRHPALKLPGWGRIGVPLDAAA
jgi:hypothetical protein